jgi:Na+/H+-dicarboxylate symporter
MTNAARTRSRIVPSLLGLGAAFVVGAIAHRASPPWIEDALPAADLLAAFWTTALQLTTVPFVATQLVVTLAGGVTDVRLGRLGVRLFVTLVGLLCVGVIFALVTAPIILHRFPITDSTIAAFRIHVVPAPFDAPAVESAAGRALAALRSVKSDLAVDSMLFPVLVLAIVTGVASRRLPHADRDRILSACRALNAWSYRAVSSCLALMPAGVFLLTLPMVARVGISLIGTFGYYLAVVCSILAVFILCLYPIAILAGRIEPGRFARATAPAQTLAASSRSSIVALPALLDGADRWLPMARDISHFVLPLCVATFKISRPVFAISKMFFAAALYAIVLDPAAIAVFALTLMVISFATPGLPGNGSAASFGAFAAVGVPIEAIVLIDAVDDIPDVLLTVANVTGNMTALAIVSRLAGAIGAIPDAASGRGISRGPRSAMWVDR